MSRVAGKAAWLGGPLEPPAARSGNHGDEPPRPVVVAGRYGWPPVGGHRPPGAAKAAYGAHNPSPQGSALAPHNGARGGEQDWGAP